MESRALTCVALPWPGAGATFVAPATMVAPDDGPGLPHPGRHVGAAPVTFVRAEQRRAVPLLLCNLLKTKAEEKTLPAGIGFAFSWSGDRTQVALTRHQLSGGL